MRVRGSEKREEEGSRINSTLERAGDKSIPDSSIPLISAVVGMEVIIIIEWR